MDPTLPAIVWAAAYLVGAIPFGYLVARARGVNIFEQGSGNIGATNVGRVLGRRFGVLVFVLDFLKGALPVAVAIQLAGREGATGIWARGALEVGAGLAAFLGHLFPVFLGFRGGKGVATGAGAVTLLFPLPMLAAFLTWLAIVSATRYVSLGSVAAPLVLLAFYLLSTSSADPTDPRTLFLLFAVALVLVKHRANLGRLWHGTENRIKEHRAMEPVARGLHVLALALWCGSGVFFSFAVALPLFQGFEAVAVLSADRRPAWFPLPEAYARTDEVLNGPKEQGSRAAGHAVGRIFPWYYRLHALCACVALGTALGWARHGGWHRRRVMILGLALALVFGGWLLDHEVSRLRPLRNEAADAYLQATGPASAELRDRALELRRRFFAWHQASLFVNLGAVLLTVVATALAGQLPGRPDPTLVSSA